MRRRDIDLDRLRSRFDEEAKVWGRMVRNRRRLLNLNQADLAKLVGCPVQTISKVELGQIVPRDYLKAAIAVRLASEVDELFPFPERRDLAVSA